LARNGISRISLKAKQKVDILRQHLLILFGLNQSGGQQARAEAPRVERLVSLSRLKKAYLVRRFPRLLM
jgi:hypothetical protein